MAQVILEAFSEGAEEATINSWFHEEGDEIAEGDELVEVNSEEGTVIIYAPFGGVLTEVYCAEGDLVSPGDVLCEIDEN
jgi:pyruvate/2-oxoglutarate dehydrogenase complex dihydrolipoamide acyltransferase (E2) component